jgi:hypothetical protein
MTSVLSPTLNGLLFPLHRDRAGEQNISSSQALNVASFLNYLLRVAARLSVPVSANAPSVELPYTYYV